MAEIEDKVILELLREGKIIEENIINDVYRMYLQLKKAGDSVKLLEVFVNRGYLTNDQIQQIFNQNNVKSPQKISDYHIVKKLGAGGMASVFLVKKEESSALFALKVLPKSSSQNEKIVARFNREFRALQQLKHSAIIGGIEKGFSNGYHFYVMEYFEGQNLKSYIQNNKPIDFKFAVELVRSIAIGLQYAVNLGIIHRDIKPDNIIITKNDGVKIIDFGLVKIEHEDSLGLTKTQTAMGTPHFISCEQAKNAKEADLRSDIYSLGATLFYMVTSEYPVKGTTAYEVLAALISGQVAKPNIVNPLIPEALNQLILNMMGLAVEDRYQNYEELLSDIDLFLKGSKIKPLIRDQHQATKYIIAKKNIIVGATLLILISIIIFLYSFKPIKETVVKIENNESKISVNELEEFNDQIADNTKKEVFKYSILDSFDREYKRETSLESSLDSKLELLLSWLSLKEIDAENGSKDEKLQAKAFTILAFCGAGYDYYKGPELKKMEAYLRYIINSQNEGKWSEDMWVNVLCANSIIESFAMHGSDNQELAELSLKALSQLEIQSKDTSLKSIDKSILGAHLYILAIKFSRIVRLPKLNKLTPKQFKFIGEIISTFSDSKKENKISFLEQLDHEAVAQLFGKIGETNTFLKELEEKKYVPVSCREAYFFMFFYGIASNKKENKWLFDNAVKFLNTKEIFDNEIKELSDKNGEIITNAIAALAIENIYRIPRDIIPKKRGDILKKIRNR